MGESDGIRPVHLAAIALLAVALGTTARAVAEFDVPMRVLGVWWGNP